mmetsp:Transcript_759/g.1794  ORF Transcript_759/g.1794 Transcript_759/m.1794 type:complete len:318 (+) Transcript_759:456-1409(+)
MTSSDPAELGPIARKMAWATLSTSSAISLTECPTTAATSSTIETVYPGVGPSWCTSRRAAATPTSPASTWRAASAASLTSASDAGVYSRWSGVPSTLRRMAEPRTADRPGLARRDRVRSVTSARVIPAHPSKSAAWNNSSPAWRTLVLGDASIATQLPRRPPPCQGLGSASYAARCSSSVSHPGRAASPTAHQHPVQDAASLPFCPPSMSLARDARRRRGDSSTCGWDTIRKASICTWGLVSGASNLRYESSPGLLALTAAPVMAPAISLRQACGMRRTARMPARGFVMASARAKALRRPRPAHAASMISVADFNAS